MNRRDFVTKLALGVAVTPAAVKASTELAPVDSTYLCEMQWNRLTTIKEQLEWCDRYNAANTGPPPSVDEIFDLIHAMKHERGES